MNTHSFEHPAEAVHVAPGGGLLGVEVVDDDGAAQPRPVQRVAESSLHLTRMTQVLLPGLRWRGHCSTAQWASPFTVAWTEPFVQIYTNIFKILENI